MTELVRGAAARSRNGLSLLAEEPRDRRLRALLGRGFRVLGEPDVAGTESLKRHLSS